MTFTVVRTMKITVNINRPRSDISNERQAELVAETFFDIDEDDIEENQADLPMGVTTGRAHGVVTSYEDSVVATAAKETP